MNEPLPFLDLKAQFAGIREEILQAVTRTLDSQQFILGPEVAEFEKQMAALTECKYAIGCASGTDALILALLALDIGPGDEVITTPFTFVASAGSIAHTGATPVFVDIDPRTFNLNPEKLERAITPHTKAIMPVHLFGLSAAMDEINDLATGRGIAVIEDAAQAIGAQNNGRSIGSLGLMGAFSFFPSKNLGASGDGGLVTTNDPQCAERLNLLHLHGSRERYVYETLGMNSRLDALQAAILRVKLQYFPAWNAARRRNAQRYRTLFSEFGLAEKIQLPYEPQALTHAYNQFTIRVKDRDVVRERLRKREIPTEVYYPIPLHLQEAFQYLNYKPGDFPVAELTSKEVLSLPIYPELTDKQQRAVVSAFAECVDG